MQGQKQQHMEAIPQESQRIQSDGNLPSSSDDSSSFQLLIKAHDRIRALQCQNEELQQQLTVMSSIQRSYEQLKQINQRLKQELNSKDIKIDNLQKINQKAILDFVRLQRELYLERKQGRMKRNLSALPSQLCSPLHPMIRTDNQERVFRRVENIPKSRQGSLDKSRPVLRIEQNRISQNHEFTFDCSKEKTLKNCCSVAEMSKLVNKIHTRHQSKISYQKDKIKDYRTYCASMEKKYSPSKSITNQRKQNRLSRPQYPPSIKKCASPKTHQFRSSFAPKWQLSSTSTSNTFGIWTADKYTFA